MATRPMLSPRSKISRQNVEPIQARIMRMNLLSHRPQMFTKKIRCLAVGREESTPFDRIESLRVSTNVRDGLPRATEPPSGQDS